MSSTRKFILLTVVVLACLTVIAKVWRTDVDYGDKTPLVWTTDPNPQRGPQVDLFNSKYPDCFLEIDPSNNDKMKVMVQCSANMGPDIIGQINEGNFQLYHAAGILMDVTDQAKAMGFGVDTLPPQIRPLTMMKILDKDGNYVARQYGYPCNVWHGFILYNKNLFDKYGVEYPSEDLTWEEYIDKVKQLTKYTEGSSTPEVFGGMDAMSWASTIMRILVWEMGGAVMNEDGTRSRLADPETIKGLVYYHSLLHKLKVEPTPDSMAGVSGQGGWGNGPINWFGGDKIGMIWGARWMLVSIRRFQMEQRKTRDKWLKEHPGAKDNEGPQVLRMGACKVPRFRDGKRYTVFGARLAAVNSKGRNPDKAVKFLQYLASKEYCDTINMGADSKPGAAAYNKLELMDNPDHPGEEEISRMSVASIPDSRLQARSPFINNSQVNIAFSDIKSKLISSKELSEDEIRKAAERAADEIDRAILRAIQRNKGLQMIYATLKEEGCEPIRHEEEL